MRYWKALAMLRAYFDESGTHGEAYVTSIAGYVATHTVWESVETEWDKEMSYYRQRTAIRTFHLTDCLAGKGEFAGLDEVFRLALTSQLSRVLGRHDVHPVWAAVVVDDWYEATPEDFRIRYPKPFDLCFEEVVVELWRWATLRSGGEKVSPMFAHQEEYASGMDAVDRAYRLDTNYRQLLGTIAFGSPSEVIPLQAADILSHEISEDWRHVLYDTPTLGTVGTRGLLLNATRKNGLVGHGGCFDGPALSAAIGRFRNFGSAVGPLPWAGSP